MYQLSPLMLFSGISLALLSTICFNVSPILQKEALITMAEITKANPLSSWKSMFTNKKWFTGFMIQNGGGVLYMISIEIAGVTVVQPLLNVGALVLAITAKLRLGEQFDVKAKIGIACNMAVPLFMALSGVSGPVMFENPFNLTIFSLIMMVISIVCFCFSRKFEIGWAFLTGFVLGLAAIFTQWFSMDLFGGSNLIQGFFDGLLPFTIMMCLNLLGGLYFSQVGLQKLPASRFSPIAGTVNVFGALIGGIIIFDQVIGNVIYYACGVALGTVAVLLLARYQVNDIVDINKIAWDRIAEIYEQKNPAKITPLFKDFLSQLYPGAKVLDLGCGTGKPFLTSVQEKGVTSIIGVDVSREMVEIARKNVPGATFQVKSMTEINWDSEFVGIIASYSLLLLDPPRFKLVVGKIAAALKNSGYVYVSLNDHLDEGENRKPVEADEETIVSISGERVYSRAYSRKEVCDAFLTSGLKFVDFKRREIESDLFGKENMMEFLFRKPNPCPYCGQDMDENWPPSISLKCEACGR